ncbi:MAG: EF2563 family selenium-dependent molybdenum hydroxylase system protein [Treponema sp.]|nr:EF2563 family selenium-dependent molybdenum hydroxylase system protein [Treponema sp.]
MNSKRFGTVLIKGAGDLASGTALRLRRAGFDIVMTEVEKPLAVRRSVCFSETVYQNHVQVEDCEAMLAAHAEEALRISREGKIAVLVDPQCDCRDQLKAPVLIDAIMAKRNTGTSRNDARSVIALGPGFTAGTDCHAVIETMRGHTLGRVITKGGALPNTGVPGEIGGYSVERLLRSPAAGIFRALVSIGDTVQAGDTVAEVSGLPIQAGIGGVVRGILPSGIEVFKGMKAGDIDPRCKREHCFTVSDKALAVAGGVLEAILGLSGNFSF